MRHHAIPYDSARMGGLCRVNIDAACPGSRGKYIHVICKQSRPRNASVVL